MTKRNNYHTYQHPTIKGNRRYEKLAHPQVGGRFESNTGYTNPDKWDNPVAYWQYQLEMLDTGRFQKQNMGDSDDWLREQIEKRLAAAVADKITGGSDVES